MSLPRIFRTAAFRLALAYAALFALSTVILFAFVYVAASAYSREQLEDVIEAEAETMVAQAKTEGVGAVAALLRAWEESDRDRPASYRLFDSAGRPVAGELGLAAPREGWFEFVEEGDDDPMLGLGTRLPGGNLLVVAQESELHELTSALIWAFVWAGGASLALAVLGGVVTSGIFLRRLENFNRTATQVIKGKLEERVPRRGTNDEFDILADKINAMLDRIQALMESMRQVSNDIAHDLRTPLSHLRQHLELARRDERDVAGYERAVDSAIAEADEILATFSALLRIAQIDAGTRRAGFTDVDLSAVFEMIAETFSAVAEDNKQRLEARIAPGIRLRGDRELLTQMLANLSENAIRHTPAGSTIKLSLGTGASGAIGTVVDDGPGIPEDAREKVFRRFFRMEASRTTPGNGLGLSLVAAVAELHGIKLDLADARPGLTVTLRFPPGGDRIQQRRGGAVG